MPTLLIRDMHGGDETGPQAAFRVPAEGSLDGGTLEQDGRISVDDRDEVRGVLNKRRKTGLTGSQFLGAQLHFGLQKGAKRLFGFVEPGVGDGDGGVLGEKRNGTQIVLAVDMVGTPGDDQDAQQLAPVY